MGTVEPSLEELLEQKKRVRNPLVPVAVALTRNCIASARSFGLNFYIATEWSTWNEWLEAGVGNSFFNSGHKFLEGALMTAGVLTAGLMSFRRGNSKLADVNES